MSMTYPFKIEWRGRQRHMLAQFASDRFGDWDVEAIELGGEVGEDTEAWIPVPAGTPLYDLALSRLADLGHDIGRAWGNARSLEEREPEYDRC